MRRSSPIGLNLLFYTAFTLSLFSSCYEPIEGCLNPLSTNFQLDADNACDDCCNFPSIGIQFFPLWDTFNLDTVNFFLTNELGQNLRINQSQFFISNVFLTGTPEGILSTRDSVILNCEPPQTLFNTLDIISLTNQTAEIEDVILDEGYNTVHVDIGISECLASIDTVGFTNQIPTLENLSSVQMAENEFLSHEFVIEFEDDLGTERIIRFVNSEALVSLDFTNVLDDFFELRGTGISIDIDVRYDLWFSDLLSSDTDEQIKQKILQNSIGSFTLRE